MPGYINKLDNETLSILQIAETTKEAIKTKASSYMERFQESGPAKTVHKQVDNVISLSELMVEVCFPTDGSDPEQLAELEREENAENAGHSVRITNLKDKLKHRGSKRLLTLKPVQMTVDAVSSSENLSLQLARKKMVSQGKTK